MSVRVLYCLLLVGCGQAFSPRSLVKSVRLLQARTDRPYAKPGETVTVQVLGVDGRAEKPEPMQIYWLPVPCFNPPADNYLVCLNTFSGFPTELGTDLTPFVHTGESFSYTLPPQIIARHIGASAVPYGLSLAFVFACAGHLEPIKPDPDNAQSPPVGCFDSSGKRVGADDYVFAFSRVYAYADISNNNPQIAELSFYGAPIDPVAGITIKACTDSPKARCPRPAIHLTLAEGAQEQNPLDLNDDGTPRGEDLTAAYYTSIGKVGRDTLKLYDAITGQIPNGGVSLTSTVPGDGTLWIVVRDNRGGANWVSFDVHVE